ncbi:hypothetical protein D1007_27739 [Hordeum vulgare]|nr:hypothetical protein D1007_27739 [Hordeum vulgare]
MGVLAGRVSKDYSLTSCSQKFKSRNDSFCGSVSPSGPSATRHMGRPGNLRVFRSPRSNRCCAHSFFFFRMFCFSLVFYANCLVYSCFIFFLIFHQFPLFHSLRSLTLTFLSVSTILFFLVSSQVFLILIFPFSCMH